MHTNPKDVCVPLTVASVSQGAGTDGTSLIAEMMCVASTEASGCNKIRIRTANESVTFNSTSWCQT